MNQTLRMFVCLLAVSLAFLWPAYATAQVSTAEIMGTVVDASGGVIPGATVTLKNLNTGNTRTSPTNEVGVYVFTLLPIGDYSLTVELNGFKTYTVPKVNLAAGDKTRVDAKMQIGGISETVEVNAESVGLIQTDNATLGGVLTTRPVQDLPLDGRQVMKLAQLLPGGTEGAQSSMQMGNRPDDRRVTFSVVANGQIEGFNYYLIDGMDNIERTIGTIGVKPSVDALSEVKVTTNLYSADTGRTGGAVINMLTKSGTNGFHGSLYEYLRNDIFDAKNYFNIPQAGNPLAGVKPKYRQNQFGGSIGGPIIKNKLFFFGDYEGLRVVQGVTAQTPVPTPCMLGRVACNGVQQIGNFSELLPNAIIYDVSQSKPTPFTNNIIPLNRISSISKNYAALWPTSAASSCTPTSGTCLFVNSPVRTQQGDSFDTRIDSTMGTKDTLFVRYTFNQFYTFTPGVLPKTNVAGLDIYPGGNQGSATQGADGFPGPTHQRSQGGAAGYTHTFRPTLVMDAGLGFLRYRSSSEPLNYGQNVNTAFGGPPVNVSEQSSGLAPVLFNNGGYGGVGDAQFLPTQYWDTTYLLKGGLNWTKGHHIIKSGGSFISRRFSNYQSSYPKGSFSYSSQQTNSTEGGQGGTGGNSFASLLLGYPVTQSRNLTLIAPQLRVWEYAAYVQDDWRLTGNLTVNLGIRWDLFTKYHEKHNQISSFDPTDPATLAGGQVLVAGQGGVSEAVNISNQYTNFAPRLGIAWSLGKGFVLRGGFGLTFYPNQIASPASLKSFPFVSNVTINTPLGQPGTSLPQFGDPFPPATGISTCLVAACGATTRGISVPSNTTQKLTDAKIYQYNVTMEKEIAGNVLTVAYVGTSGRDVNRSGGNVNAPLPPQGPGGCGVTSTVNLPSPCQPYYGQLPLVSSISMLFSNGMTDYHALQSSFQRRFRNGLGFSTNYTYARGLGNTGNHGGGFTGQNTVPAWYDFYDWGPTPFDVRHRWALMANYELPFGKSTTGFAGQVVKGWQINVIALWSTGLPFTVMNNSNPQQNTGGGADRPNRLPTRAGFEPGILEWFDTTAFNLQKYGTAGNEGANAYYAPSQTKVDLSIFKNFPIREEMRLQFRCEIFNLTNTPNFAAPSSGISGWTSSDPATAIPTRAGNFGKITATSNFITARDIQFALKLLF